MPLKRKIYWLGIFFIVSGFVGFFGAMAVSLGLGRYIAFNVQVPLSDLSSIAVDSKENIYCKSQGYARVNKYDKLGRFLRGWWVDASGGSFLLIVDNNDLVHIGTARTDLHLVYNSNGQLVRKSNEPEFFGELEKMDTLTTAGTDGMTYIAKTPSLLPRVMRIAPSGKETTVIFPPLHFWFVSGPFQGWLTALVGILLRYIGIERSHRQNGNPDNSTAMEPS